MPEDKVINRLSGTCLPCRACDAVIKYEPREPMQYAKEHMVAKLTLVATCSHCQNLNRIVVLFSPVRAYHAYEAMPVRTNDDMYDFPEYIPLTEY